MEKTIKERIGKWEWDELIASLETRGYAVTPKLLASDECEALISLYDQPELFRTTINMERYRFGVGEYKYLAAPLPKIVQDLREELYPPLARVANDWSAQLRSDDRFPEKLEDFLQVCAQAGQEKPTPLILRYREGGYNCLHQDLYGERYFPFQVVFMVSEPLVDFTGGEFLLVEQRPRAQSIGEAIALQRGEGLIFPTRHRPIAGTRGSYRANLRHGVSRVRSGTRVTLGIIFHNAK